MNHIASLVSNIAPRYALNKVGNAIAVIRRQVAQTATVDANDQYFARGQQLHSIEECAVATVGDHNIVIRPHSTRTIDSFGCDVEVDELLYDRGKVLIYRVVDAQSCEGGE